MAYLSKLQQREKLSEVINPRPMWCQGFKIPRGEELITRAPSIGVQFDLVTKLPITNICKHRLVNGTLECQEWASMAYILLVNYARTMMTPEDWMKLFPRREESGQRPGWPVFADYTSAFPKCPGYHFTQVSNFYLFIYLGFL